MPCGDALPRTCARCATPCLTHQPVRHSEARLNISAHILFPSETAIAIATDVDNRPGEGVVEAILCHG